MNIVAPEAHRILRMGNAWLWRCRDRVLDVRERPLIMGIVNVTPDSFSDGGEHDHPDRAVEHALRLVEQGADIIDVGGESTRPGAAPVDAAEEIRRIEPVVRRLASISRVTISIDTCKSEVARRAIEAGAHVVNDVTALGGDPRMSLLVRESKVGVVLMHMQGTPSTMQLNPCYRDVVAEVADFLRARLLMAVNAGIDAERMAVDPGIGFGKTAEHNLALISHLDRLSAVGRPLLIGLSRKRFLEALTSEGSPRDRLAAGLAATAVAVLRGAGIIRTHDVGATRDAAMVVRAIQLQSEG